MTMKKNRKMNIPMSIASILLCLVLFSLYMTSGMLAKYTTGGSGKGNGRVAKLSVTAAVVSENNGSITFEPDPDGNGAFESSDATFAVKVTNTSEVAVRYNITLKFDPAVLAYVNVNSTALSGKPLVVKTTGSGDSVKPTGEIMLLGTDLKPGSSNATETFTFSIDRDSFFEAATLNQTGLALDKPVEINFDAFVDFVQID